MSEQKTVSESKLLLLIGAVQFVNVLDFMMVMPLGPDLAHALGMPASALGFVGGSYTAAAAVIGLVGAAFLDRFDRRKALAVAIAGLVVSTVAGGLAVDLGTLLLARVAAGCFGGPASALSLAILTDVIPVERRGRAMGAYMGSFSVASVFGVPAGLELSRWGGWRTPFFAVAGLGLIILPLVFMSLPPLRAHLERARHEGLRADVSIASLLRPTTLLALAATATAMIGTFALVPNISTFVQFNLGYPRERLFLLYLVGGSISFLTMRVAGMLSDRYGPAAVATFGVSAFSLTIYLCFIEPSHVVPILPLFSMFMVFSSFRFVPMQALSSRVPHSHERARFMSLQSAVQHMASSLGAVLSAALLEADARGALRGMDTVAWIAIALTASLPVLLFALQARLPSPAVAGQPRAQAA